MPALLKDLLADLNLMTSGSMPAGLAVGAVTDDSRRCGPGVLFVAIEGNKQDGHQFLADAAARGSKAALVSRVDGLTPPEGMSLLAVGNTRRALALIAQRLAGDPSHRMTVVGVTGTNGKTTVAYMMEAIFMAAGLEPGVLSTVNMRWGGKVETADQTTPSPTVIADRLARMERDGVRAVAMEVSSHALDQHRCDGIQFAAGAFTNLTQDHLDYHGDMRAYRRTKERFFTEVLPATPAAAAVLNMDDPAGRDFSRSSLSARKIGYSLSHAGADLSVERLRCRVSGGMSIYAHYKGAPLCIETPLVGLFNAVNCLTAAGLALAVGIEPEAIASGLAGFKGAPGRFELVQAGQKFPIIVDYAHTPDSLLQVLLNARGLARRNLIVVFGCGGDRDPGKRPLMGQSAARLANRIIVTNDNPRSEEPGLIAEAIIEGIKGTSHAGLRWEVLLDRREAIREAIAMARPGDVVVIAGKGHEDYQLVAGEKHHFDDREEARAAVTGVKNEKCNR